VKDKSPPPESRGFRVGDAFASLTGPNADSDEGWMQTEILLEPGGLAEAVDARTRQALAEGAPHPIETEPERIVDTGARFLVRVIPSLGRKEADRRLRAMGGQGRPANPFLPPDPELTVAEISTRHLAVLNKFSVLDRHLLIVTRAFEHQETLLNRGDLRALFACMAEYPSLGFCNGGTVAEASQPHEHLQVVPLPPEADGPVIPMQPLLDAGERGCVGRCPRLPFAHAFARLDQPVAVAPMKAAKQAAALYRELLAAVGIAGAESEGAERSRITLDVEVCHGKPCVRHMRWPVEVVLDLVGSGMTMDEIIADHPELEREDIVACPQYARLLLSGEPVRHVA
jgi:sulfate adenylyltransferase (ADP) / ATP adenylyltransferase